MSLHSVFPNMIFAFVLLCLLPAIYMSTDNEYWVNVSCVFPSKKTLDFSSGCLNAPYWKILIDIMKQYGH